MSRESKNSMKLFLLVCKFFALRASMCARSSTAPEILPNVVSGCILLPSATRIVRVGGRTSDVKASLCLGNLFVSLSHAVLISYPPMGDHANASVTLRFLP